MSKSNYQVYLLSVVIIGLCLISVTLGQEKRFGPPPKKDSSTTRLLSSLVQSPSIASVLSSVSGLTSSSSEDKDKDKSPTSQVMDLAQGLLGSTDWNNIYVKLFKMFLNFFMDAMMERMLGGSSSFLSDRASISPSSLRFDESPAYQLLQSRLRQFATIKRDPLGQPLPVVYQQQAMRMASQQAGQFAAQIAQRTMSRPIGARLLATPYN